MIDLVLAAGLGFALGVVTGLPLGLINVAVTEAAQAGRRKFAIAIGIGGAVADGVHSAAAFLGVGRVIEQRSEYIRVLAVVTVAVVLAYAVSVWRRRRRKDTRVRAHAHGILVGLGLTLPNPAALAAWVAVAAALWPAISAAGAIVLAAGVMIGSALWFATLAYLVSRARARSGAS